jgi:hypothetical protein
MIRSFPKIFAIGTQYITDLFKEPVEVTEKVDGSQFVFGKVGGKVCMRSKGAEIFPEAPQDMFKVAVDRVLNMELPEGFVFYCEYLRQPKHNVLTYSRVPKNNLVLFGVATAGGFISAREDLVEHAVKLDIDVIPLVFQGEVSTPEALMAFMEQESYLGGAKVEGVVVKNYARPFLLGGQPIPLMAGKLVREDFKEVHRETWGKEHTGRGKWEEFVEGYRTEARWAKAVQRLRERGEATGTPKDIGPLMKEIRADIEAEERAEIERFLWRTFGPDLLRRATAGLPEWYKAELVKSAFAPAAV